jgi:hypothetical protein
MEESKMRNFIKIGLLLGVGFVSSSFAGKAPQSDVTFQVYFLAGAHGPVNVEVGADADTTWGQVMENILVQYGKSGDLAIEKNFQIAVKVGQNLITFKKPENKIGELLIEALKKQTTIPVHVTMGYQSQ